MPQSTLLVVSPYEDDHVFVEKVFRRSGWTVLSAWTCDEAVEAAGRQELTVVLAERHLGDVCWKAMWEKLTRAEMGHPMLIVMSRHADSRLWGEVLNLGGYDVLAKPLDEEELEQVVSGAQRRWQAQMATPVR